MGLVEIGGTVEIAGEGCKVVEGIVVVIVRIGFLVGLGVGLGRGLVVVMGGGRVVVGLGVVGGEVVVVGSGDLRNSQ